MPTVSDISQAVEKRFGLSPRPPQLELIARTLNRQSSLGIMPTGSGKSLSYQAAAALMPGTVLVISPLISLMRDQVEKLRGTLRVARLDSTLERTESSTVLSQAAHGELDLLYVAPERLANERFRSVLRRVNITVLAVDEAHCISAWGHDFRPDYLRLPILLAELGSPPVLALTATAPPRVQDDIRASLSIPPEGVVNTGARRENLALRVELPADRDRRALDIALADRAAPTVVYALRQADTERYAAMLSQAGVDARAYHAGLAADERAEVQDAFLADSLSCVVATIAFGMGVDKPNVRRIIHVHAARSLEGYVQEFGRAGRDGLPAEAVLLYDEGDQFALANFVDARTPSDEQVRAALNAAFSYRESRDVLAFSPYAVGDAHDLTPEAVRTLFARLELRGVVGALTPSWDIYQLPLSYDPEETARSLGEEDANVWRALVSAAKRGRTLLTIDLSAASALSGVDRSRAVLLLRRVEEEGLAPLRASGTLHRYRILRRPDRSTDTPALLAAVREATDAEHARLAAMRSYVLAPRCRQAHILAYLGDPDDGPCGVCDLCSGAPPIQAHDLVSPDWRRHFDGRAIGGLLAREADPVGLARALCRVTSPRSRPYRSSPLWGALERAPYAEVRALVEERLAAQAGRG